MISEELIIRFLPLIIALAVWELVWKGFALWKSARNSQFSWYVAILLLNTAGILPIVYIQWFQKKKKR